LCARHPSQHAVALFTLKFAPHLTTAPLNSVCGKRLQTDAEADLRARESSCKTSRWSGACEAAATTAVSDRRRRCVKSSRQSDESSAAQTSALMFKFTNQKVQPLQAVAQDLAKFLLVRGPYAWLGYAWIGCTSTWGDDAEDLYYRPPELDVDYGEPSSGVCAETEEGSGVFTREWTKASVSFDCATWAGSVVVKG